jgi:hypothetical protein
MPVTAVSSVGRAVAVGVAACLATLLASSSPAVAAPKPDVAVVDIKPVRDKLRVLRDGGRYLVLLPFDALSGHMYFGDGKHLYQQRVFGGGSEGDKRMDASFWSPRTRRGASLELRDKVWSVQCDDRKQVLTEVPQAEANKLLDAATFHAPLWQHQAHSLARDDRGTYYYVDKLRDATGNAGFRVFVGPKGNLKKMKMINVVADSEGEIFTTKKGELRLVASRAETIWIRGKKRTPLVTVPIEQNAYMIYEELGVYEGQMLGTPCDYY